MTKHIKKILTFVFLLLSLLLMGQFDNVPTLERRVSVHCPNCQVEEILKALAIQSGAVFSYSPEVLQNIRPASANIQNKPLRYALNQVLGNEIKTKVSGKYIILQKQKKQPAKRTIEGYISDPITGKSLEKVTVYDKNSYASAVTNEYGYFKLELPKKQADSSLIMISKAGQSDTLSANEQIKNEFVDVDFEAPLSSQQLIGDTTIPVSKNMLFVDLFLSKEILLNSFNIPDTLFNQVNFSVLPSVSTNQMLSGSSVNKLSFNLTVGYSQEVQTAEFGLIINIVRDNVKFLQVAGIGNIVGKKMTGMQYGGIFNITNELKGVQYGGIFNISKGVTGFQISGIFNQSANMLGVQSAGIFNTAANVTGVQSGGIFNKANNVKGVQVAGIFNEADSVEGAQAAGIFNSAKHIEGIQISGFYNEAEKVDSFQIAGFLNMANERSKFQVAGFMNKSFTNNGMQVAGFMNTTTQNANIQLAGFLNIANEVRTTQVGFINISNKCKGVPVGFISVVKNGLHALDVSIDEMRFGSLSFRTGVNRFYNIFSAGAYTTSTSQFIWNYGYGLGTMWSMGQRNSGFAELNWLHLVQKNLNNHMPAVASISVGSSFQLTNYLAINGSLSFNCLIFNTNSVTETNLAKTVVPYTIQKQNTYNLHQIQTWIGAKIGLRLF